MSPPPHLTRYTHTHASPWFIPERDGQRSRSGYDATVMLLVTNYTIRRRYDFPERGASHDDQAAPMARLSDTMTRQSYADLKEYWR